MIEVDRYVRVASGDASGGNVDGSGGDEPPVPPDPSKVLLTAGFRSGTQDGAFFEYGGFAASEYLDIQDIPIKGPQIGVVVAAPEGLKVLAAGVANNTTVSNGTIDIQAMTVLFDCEDQYGSVSLSFNGASYDVPLQQIPPGHPLGDHLQFGQLYDLSPVQSWPFPVGDVTIDLKP